VIFPTIVRRKQLASAQGEAEKASGSMWSMWLSPGSPGKVEKFSKKIGVEDGRSMKHGEIQQTFWVFGCFFWVGFENY
jgi:hypothetical protein